MQDFLDRRTTTTDLERLAKKYSIPVRGILRYTQIPYDQVQRIIYIDSYGMRPPQQIPRFSGPVAYNALQIQPVRNQSCGLFALAAAAATAVQWESIGITPDESIIRSVIDPYRQTKTLAEQDDTAVREILRLQPQLQRLKRAGGPPDTHAIYIANLDRYGSGLHWVLVYCISTDAVHRR